VLIDEQSCTFSGRRKTTTPTSYWVASLALSILQKKSFMGAKELQTTLQDTHSCQITYVTVWKGKEKLFVNCMEPGRRVLSFYLDGSKQYCRR
jgi:hypothetical protein